MGEMSKPENVPQDVWDAANALVACINVDSSNRMDQMKSAILAIRIAKDEERAACIQECEAQKVLFLSPQYASSQPVGSICERFAVDECIAAIRKRSDAA